MKKAIVFAAAMLSIVFFVLPIYAQQEGKPRCIECGMTIGLDAKYTCYVTDKNNEKKYFCEPGDMLISIKSKKTAPKEIFVKDYKSGEYIDGKKACYVSNKDILTPMGWNIGTFKDQGECKKWGAPMTFEKALESVK